MSRSFTSQRCSASLWLRCKRSDRMIVMMVMWCLLEQVAVKWQEIAGSKLIETKWDIVTTSLMMARDMFCVYCCYLMGFWKLPTIANVKQWIIVSYVDNYDDDEPLEYICNHCRHMNCFVSHKQIYFGSLTNWVQVFYDTENRVRTVTHFRR